MFVITQPKGPSGRVVIQAWDTKRGLIVATGDNLTQMQNNKRHMVGL